jgi:hypothetical protein
VTRTLIFGSCFLATAAHELAHPRAAWPGGPFSYQRAYTPHSPGPPTTSRRCHPSTHAYVVSYPQFPLSIDRHLLVDDVPFALRVALQSMFPSCPAELTAEGTQLMLAIEPLRVSPTADSDGDAASEPAPRGFEERCPACSAEIVLANLIDAECAYGHVWGASRLARSLGRAPLTLAPKVGAQLRPSCSLRRVCGRASGAGARRSCRRLRAPRTSPSSCPTALAAGSRASFWKLRRAVCSAGTASSRSSDCAVKDCALASLCRGDGHGVPCSRRT